MKESHKQIDEAKPESGEEILPLSSIRKVIAQRMSQSFQSPHVYLSVDVDTGELAGMREKLVPSIEKAAGVRLTYTDLLLKVIARAVVDHPEVNVSWTESGIKKLSEINIGLAIAVEDGLVVPVIRQVNLKSLAEVAAARSDVVRRAGEKKLALSEMKGGSLTMTNLGMLGIDRFGAIINPPESCILAVGRIADKPAVVNGELTIRSRMNLTLSIDHRVLDGAPGARFLGRIKELIEQPAGIE
ncbi:dihydrolipoamide acetyltransferase family protein [Chloroflexota bacterium]